MELPPLVTPPDTGPVHKYEQHIESGLRFGQLPPSTERKQLPDNRMFGHNIEFVKTTHDVGGYGFTMSTDNACAEGDLLTHVLGIYNNTAVVNDVVNQVLDWTSTLTANTMGPTAVFLTSRTFAEGNAVGVGNGCAQKTDQNILDVISLAGVPRGEYTTYKPEDTVGTMIRYKHKKTVSRVDFEITDVNGRTLALPDNQHVLVVLRLIHEVQNGA
jgi:hypothetical protein